MLSRMKFQGRFFQWGKPVRLLLAGIRLQIGRVRVSHLSAKFLMRRKQSHSFHELSLIANLTVEARLYVGMMLSSNFGPNH